MSGCSHENVATYYPEGNLGYLNNGSSLVNETDEWYDDYIGFVSSYYPFFSRGGFEKTSSSYAGVFYFNVTSGEAGYGNSFRMCLAV